MGQACLLSELSNKAIFTGYQFYCSHSVYLPLYQLLAYLRTYKKTRSMR